MDTILAIGQACRINANRNGAYLMFFSRSKEIVLQKLEEAKNAKLGEEKFGVLLFALNANERKLWN